MLRKDECTSPFDLICDEEISEEEAIEKNVGKNFLAPLKVGFMKYTAMNKGALSPRCLYFDHSQGGEEWLDWRDEADRGMALEVL